MSDKMQPIGPNLSDELYMRLAALFRGTNSENGVAPGGSIPSESELAERLHVGRQQIREALSVLEGFGAIVSRQGARRTWVGFDPAAFAKRTALLTGAGSDAARELLEVRHALETSMLPRAVPRLTSETLGDLRRLADDMVILADRGESFAELDEQFHRMLLSSLGNSTLDGLLSAFWAVFEATRPADDTVVEDPEIAAMHGRILDAIEEGDAHRAVHELDAHFYGVRNRFPTITFGPPADGDV